MPKRASATKRSSTTAVHFLLVFMITALLFNGGCSRNKGVKEYLPEFSRGKLINAALLIPYINASQRAGELSLEAFHERIADVLENDCKGLKLLTADAPETRALMATLAAYLKDRDIIGFSETARSAGITSIVTGKIAEVAVDARSRGFWWLTDTNYFLMVQVDTTIYDVETGARTVDMSLTKEVSIDGLEYDAMVLGQQAELTDVDKLLDKLAEDSAERSCKALREQPWIGFITAVDKDRVTLVPGAAAGVKVGMKLHIYNSGTLLDGAMGHRYFVPGLQTAAIEVVSVAPDTAQARIITGSMVSLGDSVRLLD